MSTKYLSTADLDRWIDQYETLIVKALYMLDMPMSADLYMRIFAHYADLTATYESYVAERATR
jgi:hypothetical protein